MVTRLRDSGKYTHLEMTITEGRNRQVRRMLEAVDSKVLKLVRTAIGPIRIGDLRDREVAEIDGRRTENTSPASDMLIRRAVSAGITSRSDAG